MRRTPVYRLLCFGAITVALQVAAGAAAHAQTTVGGHVGIGIPWVTWAGGPNGETTNVFKSYSINVPFGITVQGQGPVFFDFEFVPGVNQGPPHNTSLTVDPGVLFKLGHGFTFGMRAAFDVNTSRVGFIPLLNKSWPLHSQPSQKAFFKTFFVELDVPVKFDRPPGERATNPVTLATQVGFGF
jgi:hypothetical protein